MGKLLTLLTLAVLATPAAYAQNGDNNGARVRKAGFLVNVSAFERCPRGEFAGSHRRSIAVQADYKGIATDSASTINKIFLRSGDDFQVQDGNACDRTGAYLELPVTAANCSNCSSRAVRAPTFTEYAVRVRVRGKPGGKATITGCAEMFEIDPLTQAEIATPLCSVGTQNIWVGARNAGGGVAAPNQWENVSAQLLTVCVDTSGDGICDDRIGLFDSIGQDYWWNLDNAGRPHLQLVFFPVAPGSVPDPGPGSLN